MCSRNAVTRADLIRRTSRNELVTRFVTGGNPAAVVMRWLASHPRKLPKEVNLWSRTFEDSTSVSVEGVNYTPDGESSPTHGGVPRHKYKYERVFSKYLAFQNATNEKLKEDTVVVKKHINTAFELLLMLQDYSIVHAG